MNLEALRAKAEAATPGLGFAAGPHGQTLFTWLSTMVDEVTGEEAPSIVVTSTLPEADAAFIAAANPQVVLALIRAIEGISLLHVPDQYGACLGCGTNESGYATVAWPCETAAIIRDLEAGE